MANQIFENKLYFLAFLSALAISLFALESFVPKPFPFMKLGLANGVVLMLIFQDKFYYAFIVALSKVILGNLFLGTIFSPSFLLSFFGTIIASFMMICCYRLNLKLSIIGVSIIGAIFHNLTQLFIARFILIKDNSIFYFIPLMLILGLITGIISGYFANYMKNYFDNRRIVNNEI